MLDSARRFVVCALRLECIINLIAQFLATKEQASTCSSLRQWRRFESRRRNYKSKSAERLCIAHCYSAPVWPLSGICLSAAMYWCTVFVHLQGLIVDQTIEKVSFCAPDRNHEKGFAYICRDGTTRRWMCHGFLAVKESVSVSVAFFLHFALHNKSLAALQLLRWLFAPSDFSIDSLVC